MFNLEVLFDVTGKHLLFSLIPESLGLLIFGVGLVGFAVSLRWLFNRNQEIVEKTVTAEPQKTRREFYKR